MPPKKFVGTIRRFAKPPTAGASCKQVMWGAPVPFPSLHLPFLSPLPSPPFPTPLPSLPFPLPYLPFPLPSLPSLPPVPSLLLPLEVGPLKSS